MAGYQRTHGSPCSFLLLGNFGRAFHLCAPSRESLNHALRPTGIAAADKRQFMCQLRGCLVMSAAVVAVAYCCTAACAALL